MHRLRAWAVRRLLTSDERHWIREGLLNLSDELGSRDFPDERGKVDRLLTGLDERTIRL